LFGRISGAPADRNLIDLYVDGGLEFIGLSDKRPDDKFGIAAGYAHISKRAQHSTSTIAILLALLGGKRVIAFAVEGGVDAQTIISNTFEIEWPRKVDGWEFSRDRPRRVV
jgi:hypothetical protein